MKLTFAHLCDYASVSREGKPSVMGIFSVLYAQKVPVKHPVMYVVFELEFSAAELNRDARAMILIQDADGADVVRTEMKFHIAGKAVAGERPRLPQIVQLRHVEFKKFGAHQFTIFLNDRLEHESTVTLVQLPAVQPPKP